jgi:Thymidylate synthase
MPWTSVNTGCPANASAAITLYVRVNASHSWVAVATWVAAGVLTMGEVAVPVGVVVVAGAAACLVSNTQPLERGRQAGYGLEPYPPGQVSFIGELSLSYSCVMLGMRIEADTIGTAWLAVARRIVDEGAESAYDAAPILELERVTLSVERPASMDPIVSELGDAERLAWMHANFTDQSLVRELGDARSYASRLYDYAAAGRDQVQWVIDRLRADPTSRSATITTFEPLLDTTYIPCVSLLDFWIRDAQLHSIVYAHSIDFGAKGYGNLVELAYLMERVADGVKLPVGRLDFIVKSAHIYEPDIPMMREAVTALAA